MMRLTSGDGQAVLACTGVGVIKGGNLFSVETVIIEDAFDNSANPASIMTTMQ
ncbi:hypothetical protein [Streptococcus sp. 20-1249]|uniref:hypothetical protein n=1 Tax=Streptococcus hepaticus TaxID=3349163 RepID=UPI00374807B7